MFEPITGSASSTRTVSKALPVMVVPRIVGESPSSTYHRENVIADVCSQEVARVAAIRKSGGLRRHVIGHRHHPFASMTDGSSTGSRNRQTRSVTERSVHVTDEDRQRILLGAREIIDRYMAWRITHGAGISAADFPRLHGQDDPLLLKA